MNYPDYIDSRFDVIKSEFCDSCQQNFKYSGIVINLNPICAHCKRCTFIRTDLYTSKKENINNEG